MPLKISSYCQITDSGVWLNGEEIPIIRTNETANAWLDDIYRSLELQYLKFFKMDKLCKAGFLAAELVCNDIRLDKSVYHKDIAVVCFNRSSSLDDDTLYQATINDTKNYFPSPAVFVYTLANIVTGEIAIRNKIMGETSFYISEKRELTQMRDAIIDVFQDDTVNGLLCGWVEYFDNQCDVLMMYVERERMQAADSAVRTMKHEKLTLIQNTNRSERK